MTHTVADVMTTDVVAVDERAPFRRLVGLMHECRVSALPVVDEGGRIIGVVSEADLLVKEDPGVFTPHLIDRKTRRVEREKASAAVAGGLMTTPAVTITPRATVTEAAHLMRDAHVKRLFVTDEAGMVIGVVSRVDLLLPFLRPDPEIAVAVEEAIGLEPGILPDTFEVTVADGVVQVSGRVERRTIAPQLVAKIRAVEGVVGVDSHLTWDLDDTVSAGFGAGWVGV
jgi:CBS domain-containing protein